MERFVSILLCFIILLQANAWSASGSSYYGEKLLPQLIQRYNQTSQEEKRKLLNEAINKRPQNDQNFWKENVDLKNLVFSKISHDKGAVVVLYNKKTYSVVFKSPHLVQVNGKELDISPGKLAEASAELEKILNSDRTSLVEFFIPSAHAWVGLGLAFFIGILVLMPIIGTIDKNARDEEWMKELTEKCQKVKVEAESLHTQSEKQKLHEVILVGLSQLEKDPHCGPNGDYVDREWEKPKCEHYKNAKRCLEEVDHELTSTLGSVNQSDRGEVKDSPPSRRPANARTNRATNQ